MDGVESMEQLFRDTIEYASGSCQGLDRGGVEVGGGGGNISGGGRGCYQRIRGGRDIGGGVDGYQEVDEKWEKVMTLARSAFGERRIV